MKTSPKKPAKTTHAAITPLSAFSLRDQIYQFTWEAFKTTCRMDLRLDGWLSPEDQEKATEHIQHMAALACQECRRIEGKFSRFQGTTAAGDVVARAMAHNPDIQKDMMELGVDQDGNPIFKSWVFDLNQKTTQAHKAMVEMLIASREGEKIPEIQQAPWVPIDQESCALLRAAFDAREMTGGLMDITTGVLKNHWSLLTRRGDDGLPPLLSLEDMETEFRRIKPSIGFDLLQMNPDTIVMNDGGDIIAAEIRLIIAPDQQVPPQIDLGGLGKEWALDRVGDMIRRHFTLEKTQDVWSVMLAWAEEATGKTPDMIRIPPREFKEIPLETASVSFLINFGGDLLAHGSGAPDPAFEAATHKMAWLLQKAMSPQTKTPFKMRPLVTALSHGSGAPESLWLQNLTKEKAAFEMARKLLEENRQAETPESAPQTPIPPRGWSVLITNPTEDASTPTEVRVTLRDAALTTSGDTERFQTIRLIPASATADDEAAAKITRVSHILDPKTGRPVNFWRSSSVVASTAMEAGVLSTASLILGPNAPKFFKILEAHRKDAGAGAIYPWLLWREGECVGPLLNPPPPFANAQSFVEASPRDTHAAHAVKNQRPRPPKPTR